MAPDIPTKKTDTRTTTMKATDATGFTICALIAAAVIIVVPWAVAGPLASLFAVCITGAIACFVIGTYRFWQNYYEKKDNDGSNTQE